MKDSKYSVPFIVACVMLSLLLVISMTGANFISTAVGSGKVQVAVYAVSGQALSSTELAINCNKGINEAEYNFAVSNQKNNSISQVDVRYSVKIILKEALPSGMSITLDGMAGTKSSDNRTYTFENNSWKFSAGIADEDQHKLLFTADPKVVERNYSIPDINISILTEQTN